MLHTCIIVTSCVIIIQCIMPYFSALENTFAENAVQTDASKLTEMGFTISDIKRAQDATGILWLSEN